MGMEQSFSQGPSRLLAALSLGVHFLGVMRDVEEGEEGKNCLTFGVVLMPCPNCHPMFADTHLVIQPLVIPSNFGSGHLIPNYFHPVVLPLVLRDACLCCEICEMYTHKVCNSTAFRIHGLFGVAD